jgi:hypothetical protein
VKEIIDKRKAVLITGAVVTGTNDKFYMSDFWL